LVINRIATTTTTATIAIIEEVKDRSSAAGPTHRSVVGAGWRAGVRRAAFACLRNRVVVLIGLCDAVALESVAKGSICRPTSIACASEDTVLNNELSVSAAVWRNTGWFVDALHIAPDRDHGFVAESERAVSTITFVSELREGAVRQTSLGHVAAHEDASCPTGAQGTESVVVQESALITEATEGVGSCSARGVEHRDSVAGIDGAQVPGTGVADPVWIATTHAIVWVPHALVALRLHTSIAGWVIVVSRLSTVARIRRRARIGAVSLRAPCAVVRWRTLASLGSGVGHAPVLTDVRAGDVVWVSVAIRRETRALFGIQ
jgi:hypothetical protein